MIFFNDFPTITFSGNGDNVTMTNLLIRLNPLKKIFKDISLFYDYTVRDGETPRILAHKIYGSEAYEWIILLFNSRKDVYYDWPLDYDVFNKYIEGKYGSIEDSMQLNKEYLQIIQPKTTIDGGEIVPEYSIKIDRTQYLSLPENERRLVKAYDWEFQKNEDKRKIRIIDSLYINQILLEKEKILKNVK